MKPLVYVAGPYTKPDPVVNARNAIAVADDLVKQGNAVFVPHLNLLWDLVSPKEPEDWMTIDFAVLEHCTSLVRIPGESAGADREVEFCHDHGIPVVWLGDVEGDRNGEESLTAVPGQPEAPRGTESPAPSTPTDETDILDPDIWEEQD